MEVLIVLIGVAFIFVIVVLANAEDKAPPPAPPPVHVPNPHVDAFINNINQRSVGILDIAAHCNVRAEDINVKLKHNERILFHRRSILIQQVRNRTKYRSGTTGVRLKVAKGMSFNIGGTKGSSYATTELETLGASSLVITSDRVIIDGLNKPIVLRHNTIVSYDQQDNNLELANSKTRYIIQLHSIDDARLVEAILDVV